MSILYGDIRQIAFVVEAIDESMRYWIEHLGIGPFFIKREIVFSPFEYYGEQSDSPTVSIALANSGGVQIELIQQHDDKNSIYRDFLANNSPGLQHMAAWYNSAEMRARKQQLLDRGFHLAQECTIVNSGVNLAYFNSLLDGRGILFEIADLKEPHHWKRIQAIADVAAQWQGEDPIREVNQ